MIIILSYYFDCCRALMVLSAYSFTLPLFIIIIIIISLLLFFIHSPLCVQVHSAILLCMQYVLYIQEYMWCFMTNSPHFNGLLPCAFTNGLRIEKKLYIYVLYNINRFHEFFIGHGFLLNFSSFPGRQIKPNKTNIYFQVRVYKQCSENIVGLFFLLYTIIIGMWHV